MKVERFVIEELGGLNTNFVEGLGKQPSVLKNAAFTRLGGYEFWGEQELYYNLGTIKPTIIDPSGFGVYGSTTFFDGNTPPTTITFTPNFSIPYTSVNNGNTAWYRRAFVGDSPGGNFIGTPTTGLGLSGFTFTPSTATGAALPEGTYRFFAVNYVVSENGRILFQPTGESSAVNLTGGDNAISISLASGENPKLLYVTLPTAVPNKAFLWDAGPNESLVFTSLSQASISSHIWMRMVNDARSELHQNRFYTSAYGYLPQAGPYTYINTGPGLEDKITRDAFAASAGAGRANRVYFSEIDAGGEPYANLTRTLNYFDVPFQASAGIIAMASTPGGLLIFGSNETFLLRGDPAAAVELQRFSSTYGIDPSTRPAKMSGVTAFVYQGEVYVVSLGMGDIDFGSAVQNISREVYNRNSPFVQVVADHPRGAFLCRTEDGPILRYHVAQQRWSEGPFSAIDPGTDWRLIPNANLFGGDNPSPYYYDHANVNTALRRVLHIGSGAVTFGWENLDLGDKRESKLWRSVEVYTNTEYDGNPSMTWQIGANSGTVTGRYQGKGIWVFKLPIGQASPVATFQFLFPGMDSTDVIEPPVVISYVRRGRARLSHPESGL